MEVRTELCRGYGGIPQTSGRQAAEVSLCRAEVVIVGGDAPHANFGGLSQLPMEMENADCTINHFVKL